MKKLPVMSNTGTAPRHCLDDTRAADGCHPAAFAAEATGRPTNWSSVRLRITMGEQNDCVSLPFLP